jgi:hypothetical protein
MFQFREMDEDSFLIFIMRATCPIYIILLIFTTLAGPCHSSGGYSQASHSGDPGSIPDNTMWYL